MGRAVGAPRLDLEGQRVDGLRGAVAGQERPARLQLGTGLPGRTRRAVDRFGRRLEIDVEHTGDVLHAGSDAPHVAAQPVVGVQRTRADRGVDRGRSVGVVVQRQRGRREGPVGARAEDRRPLAGRQHRIEERVARRGRRGRGGLGGLPDAGRERGRQPVDACVDDGGQARDPTPVGVDGARLLGQEVLVDAFLVDVHEEGARTAGLDGGAEGPVGRSVVVHVALAHGDVAHVVDGGPHLEDVVTLDHRGELGTGCVVLRELWQRRAVGVGAEHELGPPERPTRPGRARAREEVPVTGVELGRAQHALGRCVDAGADVPGNVRGAHVGERPVGGVGRCGVGEHSHVGQRARGCVVIDAVVGPALAGDLDAERRGNPVEPCRHAGDERVAAGLARRGRALGDAQGRVDVERRRDLVEVQRGRSSVARRGDHRVQPAGKRVQAGIEGEVRRGGAGARAAVVGVELDAQRLDAVPEVGDQIRNVVGRPVTTEGEATDLLDARGGREAHDAVGATARDELDVLIGAALGDRRAGDRGQRVAGRHEDAVDVVAVEHLEVDAVHLALTVLAGLGVDRHAHVLGQPRDDGLRVNRHGTVLLTAVERHDVRVREGGRGHVLDGRAVAGVAHLSREALGEALDPRDRVVAGAGFVVGDVEAGVELDVALGRVLGVLDVHAVRARIQREVDRGRHRVEPRADRGRQRGRRGVDRDRERCVVARGAEACHDRVHERSGQRAEQLRLHERRDAPAGRRLVAVAHAR